MARNFFPEIFKHSVIMAMTWAFRATGTVALVCSRFWQHEVWSSKWAHMKQISHRRVPRSLQRHRQLSLISKHLFNKQRAATEKDPQCRVSFNLKNLCFSSFSNRSVSWIAAVTSPVVLLNYGSNLRKCQGPHGLAQCLLMLKRSLWVPCTRLRISGKVMLNQSHRQVL